VNSARRVVTPQSAAIRLMCGALRGLLLVVLGVGYLVPALHFTLVQHEICAEHGELRHSDALAGTSERAAPSQASSLQDAVRVEHEHEHCAVLVTSSLRAISPSRSAAVLEPDPRGFVSELSRADTAHASLDLLFYAPKLAPPS
jgi:hypothetical protein